VGLRGSVRRTAAGFGARGRAASSPRSPGSGSAYWAPRAGPATAGFHAEACAPGILDRLEPVRARHGLVLEIGYGSALLTKRLVDAGHRVIATDASPAMLDLTQDAVAGAEDVPTLALPDDRIPAVDAIVGSATPSTTCPMRRCPRWPRRSPTRCCPMDSGSGSVRPRMGRRPPGATAQGRVGDNWAIITKFSQPAPDRFGRDLTPSLCEHQLPEFVRAAG
jgi:hypothetical protein